MNLNTDLRQISRRTILISFGAVLLACAMAWGGYAWHKRSPGSSQKTPVEAREILAEYLEKKSGTKVFKPTVDASKEKNPWQVLKPQYDTTPDYKVIYRLIGEHLVVADGLLNSPEARQQQNGLRVIMELCDIALDLAVDGYLAARICDAYILPNLDKAEPGRRQGTGQDQLMQFASRIYGQADENGKQIDLYKIVISKGNPKRADAVRLQLSRLLENQGDHQEALRYLREISDSSFTNAANRFIARVEQRLKQPKTP